MGKQFRRLRVLHLLGSLDRGGIETWLMHVLRRTDRKKFQMDFFVRGKHRGAYEDEIESLGGKIGRSFHHRNPFRFEAELEAFIKDNGPYDILHSHLSEYDGFIMWIAKRLGIKVRISHSHNDTKCVDSAAPLYRRAYLSLGRHLIRRYSTHCLACSKLAALSEFGASWTSSSRVQILHYGIDLEPFNKCSSPNGNELRRYLGLPDGAFVIGHVGRFALQKNHKFLLKIVASMVQKDPAVHLLMVGAGPLLAEVRSLVAQMRLESNVLFLEPRPDIPLLMLEVMDIFLFPSLHEGLGLVLLEAQAAGLPCVASDSIPEEAAVFPGGVNFVSLALPAEQWAETLEEYKPVLRHKHKGSPLSGTSFDIAVSAARLFEFYSSYSHAYCKATSSLVSRKTFAT
jgi:glycosyltransferase involved in cell wall biosynthesis